MRLPKDIDPQCIELCKALNKIDGIKTTGSCCGHNKNSYMIFLTPTTIKGIIFLGRIFDPRYGGRWDCYLDNCDVVERTPTFRIDSGAIMGKKAYADSKKIAENIYYHLRHKEFMNWISEYKGMNNEN